MTLLDCWPSAARIRETLTALQSGDPKLVLAVHQPMRLRRIDPDSEPITEQEFLTTILSETGSKVFAVGGSSGVGKSHLRYWLEAEWNGHIESTQRNLLTFQSSDPRESILRKLAEKFPDSSILHTAEKPASTFDPKSVDAPHLLRDRFVLALEKTEADARQRLADAKQRGILPNAIDRDVGTWLAKGLRDYLNDPITGKPFLAPKTGVFSSLAETIASGSTELPVAFIPDHFARHEGVEILKAGNPAQVFYKKLNLTSDQFRVASAKLMNELIAEVLTEFAPTPEVSIASVLDHLHAEGRKLLIVIEETSTSGDLTPSAATGQKWTIEPCVLADQSVEAMADFIAAYLDKFRSSEVDPDPELQLQAEAFGRSARGQLLFPFNRSAIQRIVELQQLQELHPAGIIEIFFEKMLIPYQEAFLAGQFPPANLFDFDSSRIGEDVRLAVERQYPDKAGQYVSLLAFWGGCPRSLEELQLSEFVFRAFGLEPIVVAPAPTIAQVPEEVVAEPTRTVIHPEVQAFFDAVRTGGAGLGLMTEAVLRWLIESGQFQDFSIIENRSKDEISCGLS